MLTSSLTIANRQFNSRLMLGTGKFASGEAMSDAIIASGTEIVTVALRRADLSGKGDPFANILDFIPKESSLASGSILQIQQDLQEKVRKRFSLASSLVRREKLYISAYCTSWVPTS